MRSSALVTVAMIVALLLVLGSSWAEPVEERETGVSEESQRDARRQHADLLESLRFGRELTPEQLRDLVRRWAERRDAQFPVPKIPMFRVPQPPVPRPEVRGMTCLAQVGGAADPCAVARTITEMGPCLGPDDCAARQAWEELYGPPVPRIAPATPYLKEGTVFVSDTPQENE